MISTSSRLLLLIALSAFLRAHGQESGRPDPFAQSVMPFLSQNCYACHSEKPAIGKLDIKSLETAASALESRESWEKILQKLRTGEMPPPGLPRPDPDERRSVMGWIEGEIARADSLAAPDPGRVTARRMNRAEYNNTVRDLLGVQFRPADDFPQDDSGYGFDNNGDVLSLSPALMEKYLDAAETVSRIALFGPKPLEPVLTRYDPAFMNFDESKEAKLDYDETGLSLPSALHVMHRFPADGEYDFTGLIRGFRPPGSEPVAMAFWIDGKMAGAVDVEVPPSGELSGQVGRIRAGTSAGEHWLAVSFLRVYEGLPAEYQGPNPSKRPPPTPPDPNDLFRPAPNATQEEIAELDKQKARFLERRRQPAGAADPRRRASAGFFMSNLDVTGPYEQKLGPSREALEKIYVCGHLDGAHQPGCARTIVSGLARRAYRRPPTQLEVSELAGLVSMVQREGDSFEEGIALAIQRLLVSPRFLYRIEQKEGAADKGVHAISNYELASRLSYFLWSSIPDEELMNLADQGVLRDATVLEAQVRRMLRDPKASALVENFGGQWLQFRALESVKPDRDAFPAFQEYLRMSMREETERFFEHIMREDRSIVEFIDADYTFLNQRLAEFYGVPGVKGQAFRKVDVSGTQRGGVLTQGSVLTVSSYATRTSPVLRGKWVLENILNAPPPPPPPGIPELEEAPAGASASVREQMEAHRSDLTCASCHARMDPLGFGLENFDAIGAWRMKDRDFPIDASGELPDGRSFRSPVELKIILKADRDACTEGMTGKMLTYALGRGLESYDRPAVRAIARRVAGNDYRFSSLVLGIVESLPFQNQK